MGRRIRWIGVVMILCFALVLVQLLNVQYRRASALNAAPDNPKNASTHLDNFRGEILASNQLVLAQSVKATTGPYKYERQYPQGSLYGSIVGYASPVYGTDGVEYQYNSYLIPHHQPPRSLAEELNPPAPSSDNVTLTVVPALQQMAQSELAGRDGAVVAIQPTTGAILALYANPAYDPNPLSSSDFSVEDEARLAYNTPDQNGFTALNNLALRETFPPGSTSKVVTTSAVYNLDPSLSNFSAPTLACTSLPESNKQLCNDGGQPCGGTMSVMLPASCDPGYALLGLALGTTVLPKQAALFGYNQVPPIDLPNAVASAYPTTADLTHDLPALAYAAIGQDLVRTTALQNALIAAGIANGGTIMTPHVMESVYDSNANLVTSYQPTPWLKATTQATAAQVTALMQGVVTHGTATGCISPSLNAAVKTGTAQTGNAVNNTDDWMIGFAPANDPQIAVAVVVPFQPISAYGATTAGPIVNAMLETALNQPLTPPCS